jgi:hypothetical protein
MTKKITPKHEPEVVRARGRPSSYRKEYADQAMHLCRLGATDADLAMALHTSISAIERWRARHADFRRALKAGKKEADERVKRSLYMRAVGYHYDAVKIFMPAGAKKPVYAPYVEHVPPDTTAGIFWMKNRDPAHWRDAWQVEHVTGKYVISDRPMTEEEWIKACGATVIDVTPTPIKDKT